MKVLELFAGSKTGTQGRKGSYERSKIPAKLCTEVIRAASKAIRNAKSTTSPSK